MMTAFWKMHGLGNDFAIFDGRKTPLTFDATRARAIADRKRGIGCDQIVLIEAGRAGADAVMRILNADGSEVETCGNAARCVARLLMEESGQRTLKLLTGAGVSTCSAEGDVYTVVMGKPITEWDKIPLAHSVANVNRFDLDVDGRTIEVAAVSMGNPHCVRFVADAEKAEVSGLGSRIETNPMFPRRTNVEFVSVLTPNVLRMRVWERGVGMTQACGSGACAAAYAAWQRGLTGARVDVVLDGGRLTIDYAQDGQAHMTGPATLAYAGTIDLKEFGA